MENIQTLSIDIESFSDRDLKKCGVYKYSEAPAAELLLFGYSINNGPVEVIDVAQGEEIPEYILSALSDDRVTKWAYNSNFERVFLSIWLKRHYPQYFKSYGSSDDTVGDYLNPSSWRCSMVWGAYMGLPLSLKGVGAVLKLDEQKMSEGADLIRYFCVPCKPTKSNGERTRNLPCHAPDKWKTFKAYNKRDVEVELAIKEKLKKFPIPEFVWDEYHIDQQINDRGIGADMQLVNNAIAFDEISKGTISEQMKNRTNLDNPNSVVQMRSWLADQGVETETLGKKAVNELMKEAPKDIAEVLSLRQQLAKSSVKKYQAMANAVCDDSRARGMFMFYGANRTGRWAGRIINLQNLIRNNISDLAEARELVRQGDYEAMEMLYDDIPDTLSQLIRTAFVAKPGYKFYVADFSAIEARVIAYIAGESWRNELFKRGGDIYCQSASQMFHVPVEKHGINGHLRQKGKIAELACIAEGSLVLTDSGLVRIEEVTTDMKVWDGESWVNHEGVLFKGEREVITYKGLTATPDHLVWIEGKQEPVQFGIAASSRAHLIITGDGRKAIKIDCTVNHPSLPTSPVVRTMPVYDIRNAGPHHRFTVSDCLVHNCGYGGSVGALKAMGALEMGLQEDELQPLVDAWRSSNPNIVQLWWDVDTAVKQTVKLHIDTETHGIKFSWRSGMLFITLPSGRSLTYVKPRIGENKFGGESVTYEGIGATKKWERIESYGPKFVENIVQAISRDLLMNAMKNLPGYFICGHVHDELIIECKEDISLEDVCTAMAKTPDWMPGILLRADGYVTPWYCKD